MRVGLIQSNFVPWRGYFDFIDDCDLFIYHDDLQYTKGDWRNRNRIKTARGLEWITVPVRYREVSQRIQDTAIDYSQDWIGRLARRIEAAYRDALHREPYVAAFEAILCRRYDTISQLNAGLTAWVMEILGIRTPVRRSSEFAPAGAKTDRIVAILKQVGATVYLSGPAGRNYLDERQFVDNGIQLEYKKYAYATYRQLFGEFEPRASVLDLLFNVGAGERACWKSLEPSEPAGRPEPT